MNELYKKHGKILKIEYKELLANCESSFDS